MLREHFECNSFKQPMNVIQTGQAIDRTKKKTIVYFTTMPCEPKTWFSLATQEQAQKQHTVQEQEVKQQGGFEIVAACLCILMSMH